MNKYSSFLVHLHLLHFVIIKKISIFKRKILHFSKDKSPKPYFKGKISTNKSSKGKISIFQRKNLQNHIPKEKSPMNKSSIKNSKFLQKFKISKFFKKKKKKKEIFKKGLGTRGIGLVLLRLLSKKNH